MGHKMISYRLRRQLKKGPINCFREMWNIKQFSKIDHDIITSAYLIWIGLPSIVAVIVGLILIIVGGML